MEIYIYYIYIIIIIIILLYKYLLPSIPHPHFFIFIYITQTSYLNNVKLRKMGSVKIPVLGRPSPRGYGNLGIKSTDIDLEWKNPLFFAILYSQKHRFSVFRKSLFTSISYGRLPYKTRKNFMAGFRGNKFFGVIRPFSGKPLFCSAAPGIVISTPWNRPTLHQACKTVSNFDVLSLFDKCIKKLTKCVRTQNRGVLDDSAKYRSC